MSQLSGVGPTLGQKDPGHKGQCPHLWRGWQECGAPGLGSCMDKGCSLPPLPIPEKMVTSEALDGVPILVLANKQDVEVSLPTLPGAGCLFQGRAHLGCPSHVGGGAQPSPVVSTGGSRIAVHGRA